MSSLSTSSNPESEWNYVLVARSQGRSVRVGCWSSRRHGDGDDDSRLFVRSFVRSIRSGGILPHSNCGGI